MMDLDKFYIPKIVKYYLNLEKKTSEGMPLAAIVLDHRSL